jgi:hypothetical protein
MISVPEAGGACISAAALPGLVVVVLLLLLLLLLQTAPARQRTQLLSGVQATIASKDRYFDLT